MADTNIHPGQSVDDSIATKPEILSVPFDLIGYSEAFERTEHWRQTGQRQYVSLTNPHSVMLCRRDQGMARATRSAGMILPDGIGVILAARVLGYANRGRATGPTLMLKLCDWGERRSTATSSTAAQKASQMNWPAGCLRCILGWTWRGPIARRFESSPAVKIGKSSIASTRQSPTSSGSDSARRSRRSGWPITSAAFTPQR